MAILSLSRETFRSFGKTSYPNMDESLGFLGLDRQSRVYTDEIKKYCRIDIMLPIADELLTVQKGCKCGKLRGEDCILAAMPGQF